MLNATQITKRSKPQKKVKLEIELKLSRTFKNSTKIK